MRAFRKWNEILHHERGLRGWSQGEVADAVGTDQKVVSRWERGISRPSPYFRKKLIEVFGKNAEELGFIDQESSNEEAPQEENAETADASPQEESVSTRDTVNDSPSSNQSIQFFVPQSLIHSSSSVHITVSLQERGETTSVLVDERAPSNAYFQQVAMVPPVAPSQLGAPVDRRDFFREAGHVTVGLMGAELLDRFYRALKKPSTIDERLLSYLELHNDGYWRDHYHASLASNDLLGYAREHFQKITELLEEPLLPAARMRLCSTASGAALLVGTLFFDIADYRHSRSFFEAAIRAAQEANDYMLQAVGQGWMSLAWTYGGSLQEALACIQSARRLATFTNSITVRAWLAAVDAETQAKLHNDDACRKALDEAACLEDPEKPEQIHYWTSYDHVQFEGYKGICFRLLYQSDKRQTRSYLTEAQRVLKEALLQTDPVIIRLRSTFLSDLADTYVQQREIEEACGLAQQALITNAPQSQMIVQRVLTLRQDLELYKNTQEVKNLDAFLMPFLTPSRFHRGIV